MGIRRVLHRVTVKITQNDESISAEHDVCHRQVMDIHLVCSFDLQIPFMLGLGSFSDKM